MRRFCFLLLFSCRVFACDVVDDVGHSLHLNSPAQRVISLSPDLTESVFAIGAGDSIIGVMRGSDFPVAATKIPVVASYQKINLEYLIALHPDLIIAWTHGISRADVLLLGAAGIPVYLSNPVKLLDIPRTLQNLGCLMGKQKQASMVIKDFMFKYDALKSEFANEEKVTVFFELSEHPLLTVNRFSWIDEIISLCGGRNIFAETVGNAPQINIESVLLANPKVIVTTDNSKSWSHFKFLNSSIVNVSPNSLARPTPRLLLTAKNFCNSIQNIRRMSPPLKKEG